ncbi:sulfurtransferase-like selenium metabolism protein YedF [Desulfolucanica intricata]|uniref:sulfurtransferase-like selenium metabolism protein YedF n=1 Tax=Desulfolucanica intricata TaxID=1285191 RepID=UPI00082B88B3|nr:sulfurtransferase-like selenium metabolism protein YedF [Desulfolucanica intricata]
MIKEVNCRGLACPSPVINTKKALDRIESGTVVTIVDNEISRDNVTMFAKNAGYQVNTVQKDKEYHITITKGESQKIKTAEAPVTPVTNSEHTVYLILSDFLGKGAEELGKILMKSFIFTLTEINPAPRTLIFINSGVKLTTAGSAVLEHLNILQEGGTAIMSCGTCLDYYGLKESLAVGKVSNMYEIVEHLSGPNKVITIS